MNNGSSANCAVVPELNGRLMVIDKSNFVVPAAVCGDGVRLVKEEASFKIKRLYTLWKKQLEEVRKLASRADVTPLELEMRREFCDLVFRTYRLQVWRDYPEVARKPFEMYDGWLVGSEKEPETCDLFRPVGLKEIMVSQAR